MFFWDSVGNLTNAEIFHVQLKNKNTPNCAHYQICIQDVNGQSNISWINFSSSLVIKES